MSNAIDPSALLSQLRSMAREAGVPAPRVPDEAVRFGGVVAREGVSALGVERGRGVHEGRATDVVFTDLLRESLEGVNARAGAAREMSEAFDSGRPDVELADVMIAVQKARISFEALLQVRNKMVTAYRDVMSMPL